MSPPTCVAFSDFGAGGGMYIDGVIFEMISHMNITACTAGCNMQTPHHPRNIILAPSLESYAPTTYVALLDDGGGLYVKTDTTVFEMMSHVNIASCTAGGEMQTLNAPHYRYDHHDCRPKRTLLQHHTLLRTRPITTPALPTSPSQLLVVACISMASPLR